MYTIVVISKTHVSPGRNYSCGEKSLIFRKATPNLCSRSWDLLPFDFFCGNGDKDLREKNKVENKNSHIIERDEGITGRKTAG